MRECASVASIDVRWAIPDTAPVISIEATSVSPDIANIQPNESMNTRAMPENISGFQGLAPDQRCTDN